MEPDIEGGIFCKICLEELNSENDPLISPCNCRGSIGHVHKKCLERWVRESGNSHCKICNKRITRLSRNEFNRLLGHFLLIIITILILLDAGKTKHKTFVSVTP